MADSTQPYIDLNDTSSYIDDFTSLGDTYTGSSAQMQAIPYQSQSTWASIAGAAAAIGGTVAGVYNSIAKGVPYSPYGSAVPRPLSATAAVSATSPLLLVGGLLLIAYLLFKK